MTNKTDCCLRCIGSTTVITEEGEGNIHRVPCLSLQSMCLHDYDNRNRREDEMSKYTNVAQLHIYKSSNDSFHELLCDR